jgi:hypothetical protein
LRGSISQDGGGERDHDGGVFAALGAVDGDRVGVSEFVEFGEVVVDLLVFVGEHGHRLLFEGAREKTLIRRDDG